ncbi:MAG: hypothetical protein CMF50_09900 [Legionellales bacterium]|nr:hypothetical protein [Legionellales bacterium]|tara:strand:+ start:18345 stop:18824 length:480 start_codon:yes stop_codon:yes gene_type:complete
MAYSNTLPWAVKKPSHKAGLLAASSFGWTTLTAGTIMTFWDALTENGTTGGGIMGLMSAAAFVMISADTASIIATGQTTATLLTTEALRLCFFKDQYPSAISLACGDNFSDAKETDLNADDEESFLVTNGEGSINDEDIEEDSQDESICSRIAGCFRGG